MVPGTGVPALPSWLSSLVLFPLLHPELHFSPLMFALGGPNSQCSALEKVTWSSECNHFFFSRKLCFVLFFPFYFLPFLFFVVIWYIQWYQHHKLHDIILACRAIIKPLPLQTVQPDILFTFCGLKLLKCLVFINHIASARQRQCYSLYTNVIYLFFFTF